MTKRITSYFTALSRAVTVMRCFVKNVDYVHALGSTSALAKSHGVTEFDIYTVHVSSKKGNVANLTIHCSEDLLGAEPEMRYLTLVFYFNFNFF